MSGSLVKIIIGVILIVASIWWLIQGSSFIGRSGITDLIALLNGGIPPFLILIGLLIVWLEWDSFKIQKELSKEEKPKEEKKE